MNEKNIILLAVLGFGAFFVMSGKASAMTRAPIRPAAGAATQNQQPRDNTALQGAALAGGLSLLGQWLAKPAQATPYADALIASSNPWGFDSNAVNSPLSQYDYFSTNTYPAFEAGPQSSGVLPLGSQW